MNHLVQLTFSLYQFNCAPVQKGALKAMGDFASAFGLIAGAKLDTGISYGSSSVAERRAKLVVQCARDVLGDRAPSDGDLQLSLSVSEFERELRDRYGATNPELVYRTDSTLERARLERRQMAHIPKVILRQGAPRRARRSS